MFPRHPRLVPDYIAESTSKERWPSASRPGQHPGGCRLAGSQAHNCGAISINFGLLQGLPTICEPPEGGSLAGEAHWHNDRRPMQARSNPRPASCRRGVAIAVELWRGELAHGMMRQSTFGLPASRVHRPLASRASFASNCFTPGSSSKAPGPCDHRLQFDRQIAPDNRLHVGFAMLRYAASMDRNTRFLDAAPFRFRHASSSSGQKSGR